MTAFLSEHCLPFSLAGDILDLAKRLAEDKVHVVLEKTTISRFSATYINTHGLANAYKEELKLKVQHKFVSLNVDGATNKNNDKVLNILIQYYDEETKKVELDHFGSRIQNVATAPENVKSIESVMDEYNLKWSQEEVLACSVSDLISTNKKRLTVTGRDIFIVKNNNNFYALDSLCYHTGGPLYNGDIEDLGGRTCIKCPWHKYKVCVDTGQNYYQVLYDYVYLSKVDAQRHNEEWIVQIPTQSVDPHNLDKPPIWTAGDIRQRTHKVIVKNGNVWVVLSPMDGTLDSDHHNKKDKS